MEIRSELLPIRVVTDTEPVLIAAVLNKIKQVCVNPYRIPQNKISGDAEICPLFTIKRIINQISETIRLKGNTSSFFLTLALLSTTLLTDAAITENNSI